MSNDFNTALAPDLYETVQGYVPGENGDFTGSPMVYPQVQKKAVADLSPANNEITPVTQAISSDASSANQQTAALFQAPANNTDQSKWWEVIALLGDTAAKVYAAKKTGQLLPEGTYTESVEDKKISWVWIAVAVVLIFLLAYFTFKKGK